MEVAALVNELQFLVKSKLTQIYHPSEREFLLQFHVPDKGKQLLRMVSGKWFCLVEEKAVPIKPSGFCMQLRKYLDNAFVKNMYQKDSERIIIFELDKLETYFLIVELFSKGNIILTKQNYEIITALEKQVWKERTIEPGKVYLFPPASVNWKELSGKKLADTITKSDKRNLATVLATDIGLGGVYAEELCRRAGVDKDIPPAKILSAEVKKIAQALDEMLSFLEKPKGYCYPDQITPLPLATLEKPSTVTPSYNEAIAQLEPFEKQSPYDKKIKTIHRMINEQEEAVQRLESFIISAAGKGEHIYGQYQPLQRLVDIVKELRKTNSWGEIAVELKKEKKIKSVNLKEKTIIVEI